MNTWGDTTEMRSACSKNVFVLWSLGVEYQSASKGTDGACASATLDPPKVKPTSVVKRENTREGLDRKTGITGVAEGAGM
jgi:hypothetical protein